MNKKATYILTFLLLLLSSCAFQKNYSEDFNISNDIESPVAQSSEAEESETEITTPPDEIWVNLENIIKYGDYRITASVTMLTVNNGEATLQTILPNKSHQQEDSYLLAYLYYSVYNGVFITELDPGPGGGRIRYGCILMDANNTDAQDRYFDTGRTMSFGHHRLQNGLISVVGDRYGTMQLLDEKGNVSSIQLEFDYGITRFTLYDGEEIPKYFISLADYFPEQEKYYAVYGETGAAYEFPDGLDFAAESVANRPLGIAAFDKEGKLLDKWDLDGVYGYEYRVPPEYGKEHNRSRPIIYECFSQDGTFLLQTYGGVDRDSRDYSYHLVNLNNRSLEKLSGDNALAFLKGFDERWESGFQSGQDRFVKNTDTNPPFTVKYTIDGTYIYQNDKETAMLSGDYMLDFLFEDELLDDTFYLLFQRERDEPYTTNFRHPYNTACPPMQTEK